MRTNRVRLESLFEHRFLRNLEQNFLYLAMAHSRIDLESCVGDFYKLGEYLQ